LIPSLRMHDADGNVYRRPKKIEEALMALSQLPANELVERSRIEDTDDPGYVPSECVLHLVRQSRLVQEQDVLCDLYKILGERVRRAVPVFARRIRGSGKLAENANDSEIQAIVLNKFHQLLCRDGQEYDERLDFYECRFNLALARLHVTARRDVQKEESHYESMACDGESNEPSTEVEAALLNPKGPVPGESIDFLYRSKLQAAISSLPPEERRVIELLRDEMLIESEDENVLTIVKVLHCSEKTVRNRRNRAYVRLRDALREEEDA
jgi:DNA-directed RNA polymerase specialized sigma24 family protein